MFIYVLILQQVVNHKRTRQIIAASLSLLSLTVMQVRSARITRLHRTMPAITSSTELSDQAVCFTTIAKSNVKLTVSITHRDCL